MVMTPLSAPATIDEQNTEERRNAPKSEEKARRKRANMTEIASFPPIGALQVRKSSDVSDSNLPHNSSQFHVLLDPSSKKQQLTDSKASISSPPDPASEVSDS